jgi:hypothetical protein
MQQDETPNCLKVGKEIVLGSRSRGLGNRIGILVGGPFPLACKSERKRGFLWSQHSIFTIGIIGIGGISGIS